jgi:glycosyltransferase involved in cell wall biosynthesis
MRVLVYEPCHWGHCYHYLVHLLPNLTALGCEVVVSTTPAGVESEEYKTFVGPVASGVTFDLGTPSFLPMYRVRDRPGLLPYLEGSIARVKPDYVLLPSGDVLNTGLLAWRLGGRRRLLGEVPGEVGIHAGYGSGARGLGDRAKDGLYLFAERASTPFWNKIHYVNALVYERARAAGGNLARKAVLCPHPVAPGTPQTRAEARRELGIEEGGRYLGLAGALDGRKAIEPLVRAFREGALRSDDRVLLAGRMTPDLAERLRRDHADIIAAGRLVLLDRFLDLKAFSTVFAALDVVCTPYPRQPTLSSVMLEGVAAGRPILTHDYGWLGATVRKFDLGWACNVLDPAAFTTTVKTAFEQAPEYRQGERARRLLAFHTPENFTASWTQGLRQMMGLPPSDRLIGWDWVVG